jgi:hypothetical protein
VVGILVCANDYRSPYFVSEYVEQQAMRDILIGVDASDLLSKSDNHILQHVHFHGSDHDAICYCDQLAFEADHYLRSSFRNCVFIAAHGSHDHNVLS